MTLDSLDMFILYEILHGFFRHRKGTSSALETKQFHISASFSLEFGGCFVLSLEGNTFFHGPDYRFRAKQLLPSKLQCVITETHRIPMEFASFHLAFNMWIGMGNTERAEPRASLAQLLQCVSSVSVHVDLGQVLHRSWCRLGSNAASVLVTTSVPGEFSACLWNGTKGMSLAGRVWEHGSGLRCLVPCAEFFPFVFTALWIVLFLGLCSGRNSALSWACLFVSVPPLFPPPASQHD